MDIVEKARETESYIVNCRRILHQMPEIGLKLPETSAYVAGELKKMDIEIRENVGVSGIVGLIKGGEGKKTIALRADMDALPIKEETKLEFASKNGNMHACGHDAHTAILLGVAKVLSENKNEINGNVKLIFQPAEEGPGGARLMLDDGAFENPKVDAVLGLHVGNLGNSSKAGTITVCYDNMMASLAKFTVRLIGKGCHGAYPQTGVDPVVMTGYFLSSLQSIVSRETAATDSAVITVGKINGGQACNIIPESVELEGSVRAVDRNTRENILRRIEEIAKGISETMRGNYEFNCKLGYPPVINDEKFTKMFVNSARKIISEENIAVMNKPSMGGEDMAYFLEKVPGTFFFLNNPKAVDGKFYPHHNSKFDIDESYLVTGAALLIQGTLDYLQG